MHIQLYTHTYTGIYSIQYAYKHTCRHKYIHTYIHQDSRLTIGSHVTKESRINVCIQKCVNYHEYLHITTELVNTPTKAQPNHVNTICDWIYENRPYRHKK